MPEDYHWAELVRKDDGATIRINVGGYRMEGRVEFRGAWPQYRDKTWYSGGKSVSITCDVKRKPENLAKDIQRRLLPDYDKEYAKALAYVRSHDERSVEAETTAKRMAALIGGQACENRCRRGDGVGIIGEPEAVRRLVVRPAYKSESFNSPLSVDFEVHGLDPETAAQVLMIIKEAEDRRERVESPVRVEISREPEVYEEDDDEVTAGGNPLRLPIHPDESMWSKG